MKLLWQQIPSTIITEIFSKSNFDGIVLDSEHAGFNQEKLFSCIQIATLTNKKCFVRVTEINKTFVRYCLDSGVSGIIFSTIENAEQCEKIAQIMNYPKYGGSRGLGLVRENFWGEKELIQPQPILIIQIETIRGIKNLLELKKFAFKYYN